MLILWSFVVCAGASVRMEAVVNHTEAPKLDPKLGRNAAEVKEHCSRFGRIKYPLVHRTRSRPASGVTGKERNRIYAELELQPSSSDFKAIKKYFYKYMPKSVQLNKILKIENRKLWPKYAGNVQGIHETNQLMFSHKCSPERWLWHGTDAKTLGMLLMDGFKTAYSSMTFNVYGAGLYFAPDPRLAHYFVRGQRGQRGQVIQLILARVAVGETAEKDALGWSGNSKEQWMERLAKPENRQPPQGFHSITSKEHIEVVTFQDNTAYPAYVLEYIADDLMDAEPYTDQDLKKALAKLDHVTQDPFCRCPKSYKAGVDAYGADEIQAEA